MVPDIPSSPGRVSKTLVRSLDISDKDTKTKDAALRGAVLAAGSGSGPAWQDQRARAALHTSPSVARWRRRRRRKAGADVPPTPPLPRGRRRRRGPAAPRRGSPADRDPWQKPARLLLPLPRRRAQSRKLGPALACRRGRPCPINRPLSRLSSSSSTHRG